jgi:hypothetical protein
LGKIVEGRVRILVKVTERVPLDEADPERSQLSVDRPVMAHLQSLYGQPDLLDGPCHGLSVPAMNQLAYINILI